MLSRGPPRGWGRARTDQQGWRGLPCLRGRPTPSSILSWKLCACSPSAQPWWTARVQGRAKRVRPAGTEQDRGRGQTAHYQVYVHSGVAQGPPAAVARYHPTPDLAHGLLRYQIDGEVLVHLQQDRSAHTDTYQPPTLPQNSSVDHPPKARTALPAKTLCTFSFKHQCRSS